MGTKQNNLSGTSSSGFAAALLGGALLLMTVGLPMASAGPSATSHSSAQDLGEPIRYVLAGATGASLRNLPDDKGRVVLEISGETPLAVYAEREGMAYLKVAVPGGVKVWVYGKYLTESARPGWVEVSGSFINMRPLPQTQSSYPLAQLDRGDRLRFIKRQDRSKPMTEDWVQVYSPPDTMVYVLAASTRALPAGSNASALWGAAVSKALGNQPEIAVDAGGSRAVQAKGTTQAAAPVQPANASAGTGVFTELAAANRLMDSTLAAGTVDYAKIYAAYQAVLALGPDAPTRSLIEERIKRLDLHRDLERMRADFEDNNQNRQERLDDLRDQADRNQRKQDPLWGRFQTRGWLERHDRDGEKIYLVRWGADFLAQVQCSSRRYELDLYSGFEIGVKGIPVSSARAQAGSYPLIDVDRIEVLSARLNGR